MELTSLMTRIARVPQGALVIALAGGCPLAALAAEGGVTHILPGSAATLIDLLPTKPGWIAAGAYLNYQGDASADKLLPIYDVTWSGNRKPGKDGKLPAVGNTVNVKDASYTNAIGAPTLTAYWKDPAFDTKQRAFYYVRVLEIPTPRWTIFDAKIFGVKLPSDVPASIQERAYTSPIW
jgi:hypothetical protein